MSYRHTVITSFIYGEDAEAIAGALREQLGATVEISVTRDGRPAYVHGWFKTLSDSDMIDAIAALNVPVDCVVLFEDGSVHYRRNWAKTSPSGQISK